MVSQNLKSYIIKIIVLIVSILGANTNAQALNLQNGLATQQFMINGTNYQLEVAQSRYQLQIGLMGRTSLAVDKGMLFVFPNYRRHGIWMKNMSIPLTVAWLDKRLTVISVQKLLPCKIKNCPISKPIEPSAYVVELNINDKIAIGDRLTVLANKLAY